MNEIIVGNQELKDGYVEAVLKRRKIKLIARIVVAVLVIFLLVSAWFVGRNYAKNNAEIRISELEEYIYILENTPYVLDRVTPKIVQEVLAETTSETSELISAEYLFTNAARFSDTSNIIGLLDWMTEKSFVQQWDGCIKAGIDLSELAVVVSGGTITITVPKAKIISYEVDYDSVKVFNEVNNVFNPISVKDKNSFDAKTADAMKKRAVNNGLLDNAQKNAEAIIKDLLYSTIPGAQAYKIVFVVAEEQPE